MFFHHSETPLDTLDVTNSREIAIGEMAAMSENPMADVELSKYSVFEGAICGVFLTWRNFWVPFDWPFTDGTWFRMKM